MVRPNLPGSLFKPNLDCPKPTNPLCPSGMFSPASHSDPIPTSPVRIMTENTARDNKQCASAEPKHKDEKPSKIITLKISPSDLKRILSTPPKRTCLTGLERIPSAIADREREARSSPLSMSKSGNETLKRDLQGSSVPKLSGDKGLPPNLPGPSVSKKRDRSEDTPGTATDIDLKSAPAPKKKAMRVSFKHSTPQAKPAVLHDPTSHPHRPATPPNNTQNLPKSPVADAKISRPHGDRVPYTDMKPEDRWNFIMKASAKEFFEALKGKTGAEARILELEASLANEKRSIALHRSMSDRFQAKLLEANQSAAVLKDELDTQKAKLVVANEVATQLEERVKFLNAKSVKDEQKIDTLVKAASKSASALMESVEQADA